jgi:hypothetical protein
VNQPPSWWDVISHRLTAQFGLKPRDHRAESPAVLTTLGVQSNWPARAPQEDGSPEAVLRLGAHIEFQVSPRPDSSVVQVRHLGLRMFWKTSNPAKKTDTLKLWKQGLGFCGWRAGLQILVSRHAEWLFRMSICGGRSWD